jgi:WD40 repeat protein
MNSHIIKFIFILIALNFSLIHCNSLDEVDPDNLEFSGDSQVKYYKIDDRRNSEFLLEISSMQEQHTSFISNFSLRIDRVSPSKESFHADGKIWFLKETGQVKIQLMDNFFGIVLTEVLAEPNQIQVKTSQDKTIHSQPMGDLAIYDPGKKKNIVIPFPVIYYSITGDFIKEFRSSRSFFSPDEKRVLVKKSGDEFEYFFDDKRLITLEWTSQNKSVKAVSRAGEKPSVPSEILTTKVLDLTQDKETVVIQTRLRSIQRRDPPLSVFTL